MRWLRLAKVGLVLCVTYTLLAALISVYTVPAQLFSLSLALWLSIFALGTWRFVALCYAARKRAAPNSSRLEFVDAALFNLIGVVGAGPFGAALILGSVNQPPGTLWKGLLFGSLGVIGAVLSYVDLQRTLGARDD
ncbi:MAG: hypothetical protein H6718_27345 [Polyangiaceae bacterium]|nr:hypothetical protein [Myxococcales bacterium]MCB9589160.1 hypothetical protein [Polyangiaceae bacterium]MCB9610020.1 hypothetical protein [Polyangiaceae bacterium]